MTTDWSALIGQRISAPKRGTINVAQAYRKQSGGRYSAYRDDPVGFASQVLGMTLWTGQVRMLEAAARSKRVTVRSGHKISKSTTAAVIVLWRVLCRPGSRTIITAPTARQVKGIIWREVKRWHRRCNLPGEVFDDPATGFRYQESEAQGFTAADQEAMAGVSGADLMFIVDEASGVDDPIFEAIEGNLAGGAALFMISNPTQTSGQFYRSHTTERGLWTPLHISSEETPNATGLGPSIPGLATAEWIAEKRQQWGQDSPLYQVRVRGNFPSQAENAVIGLGLVEEAAARWADTPDEGALRVGVDVARFGDDSTVIDAVRGLHLLQPREFRKFDNVEVAGFVLETVRQLRRGQERVRVKIDDTGLGGGVTDVLRHSEETKRLGIELLPVNFASASPDRQYVRTRDALWFGARDWLKAGGSLPDHAQLAADLVSPTYSFDVQGRMQVESKKEMKKRLGRSPDFADALALAVYEPAPTTSPIRIAFVD